MLAARHATALGAGAAALPAASSIASVCFVKVFWCEGSMATSIRPSAGTMIMVATVADSTSDRFCRGGRHTDQGVW